jgi:hypothetical protein
MDTLVDFLLGEAGPYLRSAYYFDEQSYEELYLRDDLEGEYSEEELAFLFEEMVNADAEDDPIARIADSSDLRCSIRLYDEMITVLIHHREETGTLVSLEPNAARDLVTFVYRLMSKVSQHSDRSFETAPPWLDG